MANERIRIDDLPSTSFPSLDHVVAAMKDGSTVRLTVAQLREVMLGGADSVALALKDLSNTTGPRGKISPLMLVTDDYDDALENGFFMMPVGAANAPEPTNVYLLRVEKTPDAWATQYARAYGADSSGNSFLYKRDMNNSVWSAWYRVRENEAELDARYVQMSLSNANGRDILLNASILGATLAKIADAAAGRAALLAPLGPGQTGGGWQSISAAAGNAIILPAGGIWAWWAFGYHSSGATIFNSVTGGVNSGGATVAFGSQSWTGLAWRVS